MLLSAIWQTQLPAVRSCSLQQAILQQYRIQRHKFLTGSHQKHASHRYGHRGKKLIGSTCKAQAAAAGDSPQQSRTQRHAILHDFCMCIPYGAIIAVGGLAMKLFGGGQTALLIAAAGVAQIVIASFSLKTWRSRRSHAPFTVLEAGISGWLTYEAVAGFRRGVAWIPHAALGLLSAAMTLFLLYNLAAGGNPPPKPQAAEGADSP